ncbi:MAG TPA: flagellar motor switch protein FliN [Phycisphaerae bacterium]|nr:flagellar motor switch protein FliN [Phycisphaerae bacterium]
MSGVDPNEKDGQSQEEIDAALASAAGDGAAEGAAAAGQTAEQTTPQDATTSGEAAEAAAPQDMATTGQEVPADATPAADAVSAAAEQPVEAAADQAGAPADDSSAGSAAGLSQADIDAALGGASGEQPPVTAAAPEEVKLDSAGRPFDEMAAMMEAAIAEERAAAPPAGESAPAREAEPLPPLPANAVPLNLPDFAPTDTVADKKGIELLNDVELNVKIELGRAEMLIEDVIKLGEGSVVELDKLAGDPVDVLVNDRLVARGEVIVLNENFCVRVSEIVAGLPEEEAA